VRVKEKEFGLKSKGGNNEVPKMRVCQLRL
jgi:hypothetical protein